MTLSEEQMRAAEAEGFETKFKMSTFIDTAHMVCFDSNLKIKKYENPEEIMEEFFHIRLKYYDMRKVCIDILSMCISEHFFLH